MAESYRDAMIALLRIAFPLSDQSYRRHVIAWTILLTLVTGFCYVLPRFLHIQDDAFVHGLALRTIWYPTVLPVLIGGIPFAILIVPQLALYGISSFRDSPIWMLPCVLGGAAITALIYGRITKWLFARTSPLYPLALVFTLFFYASFDLNFVSYENQFHSMVDWGFRMDEEDMPKFATWPTFDPDRTPGRSLSCGLGSGGQFQSHYIPWKTSLTGFDVPIWLLNPHLPADNFATDRPQSDEGYQSLWKLLAPSRREIALGWGFLMASILTLIHGILTPCVVAISANRIFRSCLLLLPLATVAAATGITIFLARQQMPHYIVLTPFFLWMSAAVIINSLSAFQIHFAEHR